MIDPLARWRALGLPDKPDYAGLLTFAGVPYTQDPAALAGADVAIVGAPLDDLVSDRPGARFGPRAIRAASCPPGPHLEAKVDAFAELRVVDFGDAPVIPAEPLRSLDGLEALVGEVVAAGAVPIVLGGDHSIVEADVRAVATVRGPVGLVHLDTHTDTGSEVFSAERSHGTPMYRLVEAGHVDPHRYVQIGLRGYWPGETEFEWQAERGITSLFVHDVRELGVDETARRAVDVAGGGRCSCRSTSTCSTRPSHRAREPRSPAVSRHTRCCGCADSSQRSSTSPVRMWWRCCRRRSGRPTSPPSWRTASSASCSPGWPCAGLC